MNSLFSLLSTVFSDGTLQYAIADWVFIATAAAAVLSSLAGGVLGRNSQKKENELNRQHDIDMLERQQAFQVSETDRLNEYNTPSNQLARYQTAGLNPHLMSQNINALGSATMGPQGSSTSGVAPNFDDLKDVGNILNNTPFNIGSYNVNQQNADSTRIAAQAQKTSAEAALISSQADKKLKKKLGKLYAKEYDWYDRSKSANIDYLNSQSNLASQQSLLALREAGLAEAQANDIVATRSVRIKEIGARINAFIQQAHLSRSQANINEWYLKPEGLWVGNEYFPNHGSSPLYKQFHADLENTLRDSFLKEAQAANVSEMTLEAQELFMNDARRYLDAIIPGLASSLPLAAWARSAGIKGYKETVINSGLDKNGKYFSNTSDKIVTPFK